MKEADNAYDQVIPQNTPPQVKSLLHRNEQTAGELASKYMQIKQLMCFIHKEVFSTQINKPQVYLGSNISSSENDAWRRHELQ